MGKLKLAMNLLKLNNRLGLLDAGDMLSLAKTAYKINRFDPTDYIPDLDFFEDYEYEKEQRRRNLMIAAAAATATYLIYSNNKSLKAKSKKAVEGGKEMFDDVLKKGDELVKKGEKEAKKAIDEGKDLANDAKKEAEKAFDDAKKKGEDIVEDVKKKGEDIAKDIKWFFSYFFPWYNGKARFIFV